ncbi:hypothetical protein K3727_09620 [Rhodobacteraceae bacterium M382]|nr:hypothetical protein K3727_09620 [Rhodobacteraceae bacterium M382]
MTQNVFSPALSITYLPHISPGLLSPAERMAVLIEACRFHQKTCASVRRTSQAALAADRSSSHFGTLNDRYDAAVNEEIRANLEIKAHLKILLADGTLSRCQEFLKANPIA